jgi:ATPase, AAA family
MKYYISKDDVKESINYFKELGLDSDDNLFLFLMAKRAGISMTYPVTFMTSNLSETQKKDYLDTIWMLGGLFDSTEIPKKRCVLFPNKFSSLKFYQPGTEFDGIVGRVKDTIQKKNLTLPLYEDDENFLKLKRNYQDVVKETYLLDKKISLKHLSAWLFRFTEFDFENEPTEKQFTRVIEKTIRKFLRITKRDFLWLFEDDLSFNRIKPSTSSISGTELRSEFEFPASADKQPEVDVSDVVVHNHEISSEITRQYLELNGENPSHSDIISILESKKQIVLTGVPGTGKSRYTTILQSSKEFEKVEMVQFHANYSYEDFIGSETLSEENGTTVIRTKKGVFLEFIEDIKQTNDPTKKYLFIIDELNRGNIAEIFGETILTLDRGYKVRLTKEIDGVKEFSIPENLYIVGTMNTSDRNIAFLDLAIRRRFAFVNLFPNYEFLSEKIVFDGFDVGNILKIINQRIIETLGDSELLLGQSYFIPNNPEKSWDMESFKNQFNFVILPTLKEYSFNDANAINAIIGESLADGLLDLEDFSDAFKAEFSLESV